MILAVGLEIIPAVGLHLFSCLHGGRDKFQLINQNKKCHCTIFSKYCRTKTPNFQKNSHPNVQFSKTIHIQTPNFQYLLTQTPNFRNICAPRRPIFKIFSQRQIFKIFLDKRTSVHPSLRLSVCLVFFNKCIFS